MNEFHHLIDNVVKHIAPDFFDAKHQTPTPDNIRWLADHIQNSFGSGVLWQPETGIVVTSYMVLGDENQSIRVESPICGANQEPVGELSQTFRPLNHGPIYVETTVSNPVTHEPIGKPLYARLLPDDDAIVLRPSVDTLFAQQLASLDPPVAQMGMDFVTGYSYEAAYAITAAANQRTVCLQLPGSTDTGCI